METKAPKKYKVELINGSKGVIYIPGNMDFRSLINSRQFIEDAYSEECIRSEAIVKYELVRYE